MSKKDLTRKDFFINLSINLKSFINDIFPDHLESIQANFPELIRPPGAIKESDFQTSCIRCGECVVACPFFAIQRTIMCSPFDTNTPSLKSGTSYCRFCNDFPCINACKSGALTLKPTSNSSTTKIGTAVINIQNCLRFNNIECKSCIAKCADIKEAITLISIKSKRLPHVNASLCSGCGGCLVVCPANDAIVLHAPT